MMQQFNSTGNRKMNIVKICKHISTEYFTASKIQIKIVPKKTKEEYSIRTVHNSVHSIKLTSRDPLICERAPTVHRCKLVNYVAHVPPLHMRD